MDCSAEEQMVKMKLSSFQNIAQLSFDLPNRELAVYHTGGSEEINQAISSLNLAATLSSSIHTDEPIIKNHGDEKKLLWIVLLINLILFIVEIISGFISNSMGLVADSLDMLADAIVYGLSLYAVGRLAQAKKRVAKISGYFQITLAILGFIEVLRRFFGYEEIPEFTTMIYISILALIGNAVSLILLQRSKSQEAHMQASMIFTSNDVLVNLGVILAGAGVYFSHSKYPDLIVGMIVFALVLRGAFRILKLSK